jgi:hypothetical protein
VNARRAFGFILTSVVLGALVVGAGIVLGRWSAQVPEPASALPVRLDMPLSADGRGSQRVANVDLAYAIEPFPVRAGVQTQVILTARDLRPGSARTITGTLEVASLDGPIDGRISEFAANGDRQIATAQFETAGEYRLRARLSGIFPDEAYVTLIVVRAE